MTYVMLFHALMLARRKIQDCMHMQDYGKTRKLIEDYRVMEQGQSHIHEQFCLYHEIMIAIAEGMNDEKIGEMARQALQMTKTFPVLKSLSPEISAQSLPQYMPMPFSYRRALP